MLWWGQRVGRTLVDSAGVLTLPSIWPEVGAITWALAVMGWGWGGAECLAGEGGCGRRCPGGQGQAGCGQHSSVAGAQSQPTARAEKAPARASGLCLGILKFLVFSSPALQGCRGCVPGRETNHRTSCHVPGFRVNSRGQTRYGAATGHFGGSTHDQTLLGLHVRLA